MTTTTRAAPVTGAARGIGAAIAAELAAQGHRVAVADIVDGADVHLDVTDTESVRAAVQQIEQELGPIEILVNNAGAGRLVAGSRLQRGERGGALLRQDARPRSRPA